MIDIRKTPIENEVLSNTAPINIIVESTSGTGHYFNLEIHQNGEFYDLQSRSKLNENRCEIDFKGVVTDVFNQDYVAPTSTGVEIQNELLKSIDLTINEYKEADNSLINSLNLPSFHLINSNHEVELVFNKLTSLSVYDQHIKTPLAGVISFPFFAKKTTIIKLYVNHQNVDEFIVNDAFGVYRFNLRLSDYSITEHDDVYFEIYDGITSIKKTVVPVMFNTYEVQKLVFRNNFNAWEHFYCFGENTTQKNYIKKTYKINDVKNFTFDSISIPTHYLNTGDYHKSYASTIENVLDSKFVYLEKQGKLMEVTVENKSSNKVAGSPGFYNLDFQLKLNQFPEVESAVQYIEPDSLLNMEVTTFQNQSFEIQKQVFLDAFSGTNPQQIIFPTVDDSVIDINTYLGAGNINEDLSYNFNDFISLIVDTTNESSPLTTIKVRIKNENGWSNTARLIVNVKPDLENNLPPSISMADEVTVYVNEASKTINASVVEPEGHSYTLIWTQESGLPVTMNSADTASLQISNWGTSGEREFKLTAIDEYGAASSKTVKVYIMDYKVNVGVRENNILIYGGKPGEYAKAYLLFSFEYNEFSGNVNDNQREINFYVDGEKTGVTYVLNNTTGTNSLPDRLEDEVLVPVKTINKQFDANGEILIPITRTEDIYENDVSVNSYVSVNTILYDLVGIFSEYGSATQKKSSFYFLSNGL